MDGSVHLHVGLKKTGTSYLQSILRASVDELRRQGLALVPRHEPAGHRLARAVLGRRTAGDPLRALPRQLASAGSRCLITQELLARASADQIQRLKPALGDREVHVVVTVRDIARTIPSAWQQYVKAGQDVRFDDFVDAIVSGRTDGPAEAFWPDHGVVDVVARWAGLSTPSATHVVVVPPRDSDPDELLERFCAVLGVETDALTREVAAYNESLGLAQVEVLRRLNVERASLGRQLHGKVYKRGFARGVLGPQGGRRPVLPSDTRDWCTTYTRRVVAALTSGGYDIVGDLEDLTPADSAFTDDPQVVSEAEVAESAVDALRVILSSRAAEVARARAERRARASR
jgi:hypothetical protein